MAFNAKRKSHVLAICLRVLDVSFQLEKIGFTLLERSPVPKQLTGRKQPKYCVQVHRCASSKRIFIKKRKEIIFNKDLSLLILESWQLSVNTGWTERWEDPGLISTPESEISTKKLVTWSKTNSHLKSTQTEGFLVRCYYDQLNKLSLFFVKSAWKTCYSQQNFYIWALCQLIGFIRVKDTHRESEMKGLSLTGTLAGVRVITDLEGCFFSSILFYTR